MPWLSLLVSFGCFFAGAAIEFRFQIIDRICSYLHRTHRRRGA
jgi:hypothetical protein